MNLIYLKYTKTGQPNCRLIEAIAKYCKGLWITFIDSNYYFKREVVDTKLMTGNVYDTKLVLELVNNLKKKWLTNKSYISKG